MHGRRPPDLLRPTATQRGYDYAWRKLARTYIKAHPECAWCGGRGALVDHVVPLTQGGARLDRANLQTLCRPCHAAKTRAERQT